MAGNVNGYRYPNLNDSANVPNDLQALASDVNRKLARTFPSRAALEAGVGFVTGDRAYVVGDKSASTLFAGTAWTGADSTAYDMQMYTAATLGGGWAAYGSDFAWPGYAKRDGVVWLKGLINGGLSSTIIFTLPAGFRPNTRLGFSQVANGGVARMDIESNGIVSVQTYSSGGNNGFVSLELSFPVDV